jgi:hypothetical protein
MRPVVAAMQPAKANRRRTIVIVVIMAISVALFLGLVGWAVWWVVDNIDAPGPAATGSGPCGSADAVNLQLTLSDGRTVTACTRDRPACRNGGQFFTLNNQLRSSSRRYILFIRFNAALPAEMAERTLKLDPSQGLMPGDQPSSTLSAAIIEVTPRDPMGDIHTTASGTLTVASSKGVATGRIDGNFQGPLLVRIAGTFACNR